MNSTASALVVIDVQEGFEDSAYWGQRNNPDADTNIASLIAAWERAGLPIVVVRHDSLSVASPLHTGSTGNGLKPYVAAVNPSLLVTKSVNSAFYGTPDLNAWLKEQNVGAIAIVGIQTNMCCETTARMAGNLGYAVTFVADATHTFDLVGPDGSTLSADDLTRSTITNLHGGGFATVVTTAEVLATTVPA